MSAIPEEAKMPFRAAMEAHDRVAAVNSFTTDAVIRSPISPTLIFRGSKEIDALFEAIFDVFQDLRYTDELRRDDVGILVLEARVEDVPIQVVEYMHFADDGRIRDLTAFFRPMPALAVAARGLGRKLGRRRGPITSRLISALVSVLVVMSRIGDATVVRLVRSAV